MTLPPLFSTLPRAVQLQLAVVLPFLFGGVCGFMLGASATGYVVLSVIGALGAWGLGFEHVGIRHGAVRGLVAGVVYGFAFMVAQALSDHAPRVGMPSPLVLSALVSALVGITLGALGGWSRAQLERRAAA